ncbi:hypothetical protein ACROYT_G010849 [Oculina patagonica]
MATFSAFSALAKLAAKCRRKCLLESQFESLSINCKRNNLLLRNYLKPGVCFIRHFALKSFPWTQSTTGVQSWWVSQEKYITGLSHLNDIYPRDPFLHRLCGSVLLYRVMKQVPDGDLHPKEFLKSVKGIYPYEYMDSWERFSETSLPEKEKFYSKLNDENITDEEYKHAQNVWETFGCQTLGDYHDLYVKTDVSLLADVFENFRKIFLRSTG